MTLVTQCIIDWWFPQLTSFIHHHCLVCADVGGHDFTVVCVCWSSPIDYPAAGPYVSTAGWDNVGEFWFVSWDSPMFLSLAVQWITLINVGNKQYFLSPHSLYFYRSSISNYTLTPLAVSIYHTISNELVCGCMCIWNFSLWNIILWCSCVRLNALITCMKWRGLCIQNTWLVLIFVDSINIFSLFAKISVRLIMPH